MGRKANPAPEVVPDTLNRAALAEDGAALNELGRRRSEVALRFGDGQAYDRHRVLARVEIFMAQGAEAMLGIGKALVELKENEPHGTFHQLVTERLGITPRSAQLMMQAAVKYLSPALESSAKSISHLGATKLFDLMSEPDDTIVALAEGGTVAGLELDEIDAMSTRELRDALKKERDGRSKDAKAKQRLIDNRDNKIAALEEAAAHRESAEPSEQEATQIGNVRDAALEAEFALRRLLGEAGAVVAKPVTETALTVARHGVEYVAQLLAELISQHGIPVDFTEMVSPEWATLKAPLKKAANKR